MPFWVDTNWKVSSLTREINETPQNKSLVKCKVLNEVEHLALTAGFAEVKLFSLGVIWLRIFPEMSKS